MQCFLECVVVALKCNDFKHDSNGVLVKKQTLYSTSLVSEPCLGVGVLTAEVLEMQHCVYCQRRTTQRADVCVQQWDNY